jgi:hypothetical protein
MFLGPGMSFRVTAPSGWVLDDESCVRTGYSSVVYPLGGSMWGTEGPAITTSVYLARDNAPEPPEASPKLLAVPVGRLAANQVGQLLPAFPDR